MAPSLVIVTSPISSTSICEAGKCQITEAIPDHPGGGAHALNVLCLPCPGPRGPESSLLCLLWRLLL